MPNQSIETLRRKAKMLRKAYRAGEPDAHALVARHLPKGKEGGALKHADFLHVVAREAQFESWPKLKFAAEKVGLDRLARQRLLRQALFHGQQWKVDALLASEPDLADGDLASALGLYDLNAIEQAIARDSACATAEIAGRRPMVHLAFSQYLRSAPEREQDMLAIADLLLANGADVNDFMPSEQDGEHALSVLYGAIGHGHNMPLARWLLSHGADPNDGESLYHATELGHHEGLRLLIAHGVEPNGTNALLRALDFHDHEAVRLLLDAGADPNDYNGAVIAGEEPWVFPTLHQAARRMSDAEMVRLLLDAGVDPDRGHDDVSAYGYASALGNLALVDALDARGLASDLSADERLLAHVAQRDAPKGTYIDPAKLPELYRLMMHDLIILPGKEDHIRRLVAIGMEYDRPDRMGLTPIQIAGWEGLPELVALFLGLGPDLSHVNGYGGTLLETILHGSDYCPNRATRDHIECARLVLHHGVALPRAAIEAAGSQEMMLFLEEWAEARPGQVV